MKIISIITLSTCLFFIGCKKEDSGIKSDPIDSLENIYSRLDKPIDIKVEEYFHLARYQYYNKKKDEIPVLLYAKIAKPAQKEFFLLWFAYYDEDVNVLGIGVREIAADGSVLEERYPLLLQKLVGEEAVGSKLIKISNRTDNQIKNETAWSLYARSDERYKIEKTYPTIWCSFKPDTEVFIYDKDGNVSNFVHIELLNSVTDNNETGS